MSYRVGLVTYSNFMSFDSHSADFDQPGVTVVIGENGAGKSAFVEGVAWALFGRCMRDNFKGDDVVRLQTNPDGSFARDAQGRVKRAGGCAVSVELRGEQTVVVTRYRQHPAYKNEVHVTVDGRRVERGTVPATDQLIVDIVGLDYLTFVNSTAFGAREDVRSFFSATDSDRKRILETLLRLDLYAAAEQVARRRRADVEQQSTAVMRGIETAEARLDADRTSLAEMEAWGEGKAAQEKEERVLVAGIASREKQTAAKSKAAETAKLNADRLDKAAQGDRDDYRKKMALYDKEQADARTRRAACDRMFGGADAHLGSLRARLAGLKANAECPTCKQPLPKAKIAAARATLEEEIGEQEEARASAEDGRAIIDAHVRTLIRPDAPDTSKVQEARAVEAKAHVALREHEHAIEMDQARLQSIRDERERVEGQRAALRKRIEASEHAVETQRIEVEGFKRRLDRLAFWIAGFGNSGLKSFLIEAAIPEVNRRATLYARRLLGPGALVRLSATKTLKTTGAAREEMSVEGSIPGHTSSYAGASKGQRKRLDLALLLSFREIAAARTTKAFRQLFADELFDGLDREGVAAVTELLRDMAKDCPVFLVTHDPQLQSAGDRVIQVRHVNGCTAVDGDPRPAKPAAKLAARKAVRSRA